MKCYQPFTLCVSLQLWIKLHTHLAKKQKGFFLRQQHKLNMKRQIITGLFNHNRRRSRPYSLSYYWQRPNSSHHERALEHSGKEKLLPTYCTQCSKWTSALLYWRPLWPDMCETSIDCWFDWPCDCLAWCFLSTLQSASENSKKLKISELSNFPQCFQI